jgi:RHS repeat-associated protein
VEGGTFEWFLDDALGSVRQVVDVNGTVVLARSYDPYGQWLTESGTGSSGYGFTGEQWSSSFDMIFLRARWYDARDGRFVSQDLWPGSIYQPSSLHKYLYVSANPVSRVDPTGQYECEDPYHCEWTCPPEPPPLPPSSILTPREYVEQYEDLRELVFPSTGQWKHGTLTLAMFQNPRLPERVLLAMTALSESTGHPEGMEAVMWIVRTRARFDYPAGGKPGYGTTYREQILAEGQFAAYKWLHYNMPASREFMYAFDPKGFDAVPNSLGGMYDSYKTAYRLAQKVMDSEYQSMPRNLRRLDSFVSRAFKYESPASEEIYQDFVTLVGGNVFGDRMSDDNVFWTEIEAGRLPK